MRLKYYNSLNTQNADVIIIGGGFYGCCLALLMRSYYDNIVVFEKESDLLKRASAINQARVHSGYHYPRSILTAYRSFINFPRFVLDFKNAIIDDFIKIYAIARRGSKVNAHGFFHLFREMKAPIEIAPPQYRQLFNEEMVESAFIVKEYAFDAVVLRGILKERILNSGIKIQYGCEVEKVESREDGSVNVVLGAASENWTAKHVFNCAYSQINKILRNSKMNLLPMKHEITEMALVRLPDALKRLGITVMDGPFFSTMPYPSRKLHTLSHVRYTPHYSWSDVHEFVDGSALLKHKSFQSNYLHMISDARRYVPMLREAEYVESLYEIKTILLKNENDDGRPILFKQDYGIKSFNVIMGGKIDNIYDILEMIVEAKKSLRNERSSFSRLFCKFI